MSDKTSDKRLLSCPFCGGEAELRQFYPYMSRRTHTVIRCSKCKAESGTWKIKEIAVKHWNTRKPVDDVVEALEENAFPDFEEEYTCNGAELLFLSDAIQIVKERLNE